MLVRRQVMHFSHHLINGTLIVTVSGRLDSSEPEFYPLFRELPDQYKRKVLFDLTGVTHLASKCIGQIINCQKHVYDLGGKACWIVGPEQVQVQNLLRLTGLTEFLRICKDTEEGFTALRDHP